MIWKGVFMLLVCLLFGTEFSFGQQAPGNVAGGDFRYWFRADAGNNCVVPLPVNCTPTGTWNTAGVSVSGNATLNIGGNTDFLIPSMNFNEAINTNNSSMSFARIGQLGLDMSIFVVFKTASTAGGASPNVEPAIIGGAVGDNEDVFYLTINNGTIKYSHTDDTPTIESLVASGTYNDNKAHMVTVTRDRVTGGGNPDPFALWVDGSDSVVNANGHGGDQNGAGTLGLGLHPGTGLGQLNADFAEVVIYTRVVTIQERYRIETYLAGKYGLTIPHDYLSPASVTVYDVDGTYDNNIVGVFVESGANTAGVIQSQSFSQSEGFGPLTLMYGRSYGGVIPVEMYANPQQPGLNDYFYMGHNGGSTEFTCDFGGTLLNRMERVFKTQNTGMGAAGDSITLVFNDSPNSIYNSLVSGTSYRLVVDNNPNFTGPTQYNLTDHGGNKFSVEIPAPTGTSYWSVRTLTPGISLGFPNPAGIIDCNLTGADFLWYRGDTGISCAAYPNATCAYTNLDMWEDQSQFIDNAFSFSPGTTEFPVWDPNRINFNGGFETDTLNLQEPHFFSLLPSSESYKNELTIVSVLKTKEIRTGANTSLDPTIVGAKRAGDGEFFLTMNNGVITWGVDPVGQAVSIIPSTAPGGTYNSGEAFMVLAERSNFGGGNMDMYINGAQQGAGLTGVFGSLDNLSDSPTGIFIGHGNGTDGHLIADFGEVLVFDGVLTQVEREKLQSYLAIKYGLTAEHNYLDFLGNVIYDTTNFSNGIIGLARENANGSGYYQKQSQSVVDTMLTVALGQYASGNLPVNNFVNTSTALATNEYFVMGHNGESNAFDSTYNFVPNAAMNRIYKMTENGAAGSPISILIETTTGGFYQNITTDFAIVISSDQTFGLPADQVYQFQDGGGDSLYVEIPIPPGTNFMTIVDLEAPTPAANPGGADGQELTLWLRADTGHTAVNIGGFNSGSWFDNSFTGNFGQFSVTPIQTEILGMNFNESINTSNVNSSVGFKRTSFNDLSMAVVFASEFVDAPNSNYNSHAALVGGRIVGNGDEYYLTMNGQDVHWVVENNAIPHDVISSASGDLGDSLPHIVFVDRQQSSGDLNINVDGSVSPTFTGTNLNPLIASDSMLLGLQPNGGNPLNARYGEVIIFDTLLTSNEQESLISYLAIKYGITIDQNYYDENHATIFTPGIYTNRILGIGREGLSGSNYSQTVSRSAESGALTLIAGNNHMGTIPVSNDSNQVNALLAGEFFIIGDDGGNGDFTNPLIGNPDQLLDRVWKANETGALGTMTLYFDAADIPGLATPGNYSFLHSDDNTFDASDGTRVLNDIGGGIYAVEHNFLDNAETFFTLIRNPSPGGVIAVEMKKWFDANSGANVAGAGITWQPRAGLDLAFSNNVTPVAGGANFNRTINLGSDHIATIGAQQADFGMFIVFRSDTSTPGAGVYAGPAIIGGVDSLAGRNFGLYLDGTDLTWTTSENSNDESVNENSIDYNNDTYYLAYVDFDSGNPQVLGVDGSYSTSGGSTPFSLSDPDSLRFGRFNPSLGTPLMTGDIAEYIEFDLPLALADRDKVSSYLAIKYGITLPTDYVRSVTGATLYTVAGFDQEIVGIAKDTTTFLDQRASRPARNIEGLGIVFGPAGTFPTSNAGVAIPMDDGDFLIVGHDGLPTTQTGLFDANVDRTMERTYKVQTTGIGTIDATFIFNGDFTILDNGITTDSSFVMLVSTTPAFGAGDLVVPMVGINDTVYSSYFNFPPNSIRYVTISKEVNPSTPGGLASPFSVWVQANTGYLDTTGTGQDNWQNLTLNGNNIVEQTPGNAIGISNDQLNFNPFIEMSGPFSQEMRTNTSVVAGTYVGVAKVTSGDTLAGLMGQYTGPVNVGLRGPIANGTSISKGPFFSTQDFSAGSAELWSNGALPVSNTIGVNRWSLVIGNTNSIATGPFYLGGFDPDPARTFASYDFAEVIIFEDALPYADSIQQVETYLALKYGITLERSYISTNQDTLFSIFTDTEYFNNVAGIGRADTTSFRQKQSKSINGGTVVTIGLNDIQASNVANTIGMFPSDTTWLVWGANRDGLCWTNVNFDVGPDPVGSRNHYIRLDREWKTRKIGPLGILEMLIDTTAFTGIQPGLGTREYFLALDDDGTFDGSSILIPMVIDTVTANSISAMFEGDSLDNYPYFTIGARMNAPNFIQEDYCVGDVVTMFGSNLANGTECGALILDDGISTDSIYRSLVVSDSTYALTVNGNGDCLDQVAFRADTSLASNRVYNVRFVRDTNIISSFPVCTTGNYTVTSDYTVVDSITVGVGGNPFFDFADTLYCIGAGSIFPDVIANLTGLFFTVDNSLMPINTFGLISDSINGQLVLSSGVAGTHIIAHDLLGYCPTDSIWYDTIQIVQPMSPTFNYASNTICQGDTVTLVNSFPGVTGIYSSVPAMNSLAALTGSFDPMTETPGVYTITFQPDSTDCYNPHSEVITIDTFLIANFAYPDFAYCPMAGDAVPDVVFLPQGTGWVFGSDSANLAIDPVTGIVDLTLSDDSTTYPVYYAPPFGLSCADTFNTQIDIAGLPNVDFSPLAGYCTNDLPVSLMPSLYVTGPSPDTSYFSSFPGFFAFDGQLLDSAFVTGGPFPIFYTRDSAVGGGVVCTDSLAMLVNITGLPAEGLFYPDSLLPGSPITYAYCAGDDDPFPIFSSTPAGGTFFSSDTNNLVVASDSGRIDLALSTPGSSDTIKYTFGVSGCVDTIDVGIILIQSPPDPAFAMVDSIVCENSTPILATATNPGGTFYSNDGLSGAQSAGGGPQILISNLDAGVTYTIYYVTNASIGANFTCYDTSAFDYLEVVALDTADFEYAGSQVICNNQDPLNPVILGTTGGIFSTDSTVLMLDPITGQIQALPDSNITGGFAITYTTQGFCPSFQTDSIRIEFGQVADLRYPSSVVCNDVLQLQPIISDTTVIDVFTSIPFIPGLIPDPATGVLDLTVIANDTSVLIIRTVVGTSNSCPGIADFSLTVNDYLDNLDIDYPFDEYCGRSDTISPIVTGLPINDLANGEFKPRAGLAYSNSTLGEIDLESSSPDRLYEIEYVRSVGCLESVKDTFFLRALDDATFVFAPSVVCAGSIVIDSLDSALVSPGIFTSTGGIGSTLSWIDPVLGIIDVQSSPADIYAITYTTTGACPDSLQLPYTIAVQPRIDSTELIISPPGAEICGDQNVSFEIQEFGSVDWLLDSIPILNNNRFFLLSNPQDGVIVTGVVTNSFGCTDSVNIPVQRKIVPDGEPTTWPSVLTGELPLEILMASFTDSTSFIWEATSSDNIILDVDTGRSEMINTGTQTTLVNGITLSSDFNPGTITYLITPFSLGCFGEVDTLEIDVNPNNSPIFIPGVMTPNGDNFNDTWQIQWSSDLSPDDYTIVLYNRAGGEVFRMNPIHPNFTGNNLPDGVYWWILNGPDGANLLAGGLTIRRR